MAKGAKQALANKLAQSSGKAKSVKKAAAKPRPMPNMEQLMGTMARAVAGKQFATVAEANAFLQLFFSAGGDPAMIDGPALSPEEQAREEAQDLAFDAMEAGSAAEARKLAKRALRKDPDCVDALVILADLDSKTRKEEIEALQKAVTAGERSLGQKFFKENNGQFWGIIETRPYMRARLHLAELLKGAGMNLDAIAHYEALLSLNPNDNQGVRDPLLALYLQVGNLESAQRLLKKYKGDGSAAFAWARPLEHFLASDLPGAESALRVARKQNRFVEEFLSGRKPLPREKPEMYSMGSEEEAALCLEALAPAWMAHKEASIWLVDQLIAQPALHAGPTSRPAKNKTGKVTIQ